MIKLPPKMEVALPYKQLTVLLKLLKMLTMVTLLLQLWSKKAILPIHITAIWALEQKV